MKVKLKQHYQDAHIHLEPGQVYEGELSAYLLKHRMAEKVEEEPRVEPGLVATIEEYTKKYLPDENDTDPNYYRVVEPEPAPEAPKRKRKQ